MIFPYISLFLGPKILKMHLSVKNCELVGLSLLPTLCSRFPSLRDFHLHLVEDTRAMAEASSVAVCGWSQLRELDVGGLTHSALMHVGRLPYLTRLSCRLIDGSMPAAFTSSLDSSWFPVLRSIVIQSIDLTSCSFLVEALSSAHLSNFSLSCSGSSSSSGWRHLFDAMRNHCNHSTLTSADLWDMDESVLGHNTDILTVGSIRPLFVFFNLWSVSLCPRQGIDIDDTDMKELAKAWPQLSSLSMTTRSTTGRKPRVTLAGLIPLAKYCRQLSTVSINVNACDVSMSQSRPAGGIVSATFDCLGIGDSPITDPMPVAAFLSDIFPGITSIYTFNGDCVDENSKWDKVVQFIPTFVCMRLQERNHEAQDETSDDEVDS